MATANFQSAIQKRVAKGLPGDKASLNPFVYTERNYIAGDGKVTVGKFVWADSETPDEDNAPGVLRALSSGGDGLKPLGIVERNLSGIDYDLLDGGTLTLPEFTPLNIVRRGDLYVVATMDAAKGNKVYAAYADGSLQIHPSGQDIYGAIETGWEVAEGGAEGELITITSWNTDVVTITINNDPQ
ncbi:MAG: hypothetical protein LBH65_04630 [Desulfovibrio sp.]|jgi:hypothetical protein|nr:hypothetical protein [Desulfovibrio sp.]